MIESPTVTDAGSYVCVAESGTFRIESEAAIVMVTEGCKDGSSVCSTLLVNGVASFSGFVSGENCERNHLCFSFPLASAMTAVIAISVSVAIVFLMLLSIVICVW